MTNATTKNTNEVVICAALNGKGGYIHNDGIEVDLDGQYMAEWLESCGFPVVDHKDTGRNGLVTLGCGVQVSTNGYVSQITW